MYDNRGTELQVGQYVAYNISGQVAKGRIVSLRESYQRQDIRIKLLHRAAGMYPDHISKVTNDRAVLVLQDCWDAAALTTHQLHCELGA